MSACWFSRFVMGFHLRTDDFARNLEFFVEDILTSRVLQEMFLVIWDSRQGRSDVSFSKEFAASLRTFCSTGWCKKSARSKSVEAGVLLPAVPAGSPSCLAIKKIERTWEAHGRQPIQVPLGNASSSEEAIPAHGQHEPSQASNKVKVK